MLELPKSLKILASGPTGSGKTYFANTFPGVAYLGTEPNGIDTIRANPSLSKPVVYEEFLPSPIEDLKKVFERLDATLKVVHEKGRAGEVKTLVLDNLTYLSQNRWLYINQYEKQFAKNGEVDLRSMYGVLGSWLYKFTLMQLCSFPGNVVVTCHEQREDEESMSEKADPTIPIVPNILGSFRNKVEGLFSASLYLSTTRDAKGTYHYTARCLKGEQRNAKNRYSLPEKIEDVSYQKIIDTLTTVNAAHVATH